jgi:signal transduction histidine kinase
VRDDGTGVAPGAEPGLGVSSMRTRAEEVGGEFQQRTSSHGTAVVVQLPLLLEGAVR